MATDILFPFYDILVNTIFGSVFLTIFVLGVILALLLFISRTSWMFVIFWIGFYFMVMISLYVGALGLVLGFLIVFIYFMVSLLRLLAGVWLNI